MKRITNADVNEKIDNIRRLTGEQGLRGDFNSVYGGWVLARIGKNGAWLDVFGINCCAQRMSTREFYQLLRGIEVGLSINKQGYEHK